MMSGRSQLPWYFGNQSRIGKNDLSVRLLAPCVCVLAVNGIPGLVNKAWIFDR
jgi:hypothetical protein